MGHAIEQRGYSFTSTESEPQSPEELQAEIEEQTHTFFCNGPAFTFGNESSVAAHKIVHHFSALSREAHALPWIEKVRLNKNDYPQHFPLPDFVMLPTKEDSFKFAKQNDLWNEALKEDHEAQNLVMSLSNNSPFMKFIFYTSYFYLLAKECRERIEQRERVLEKYQGVFEAGIKKMDEDRYFKKGGLFDFQKGPFDFIKEHPKEVFAQCVRSIDMGLDYRGRRINSQLTFNFLY